MPNGNYWSDSCIVKVTGKVADKDKSTYTTDARLVKYKSDGGALGVIRYDEVYAFPHEATAEAKLTIRAVNPANKIKFKKVDENGKALSGAKFQIQTKVVENENENWNAYGQPITTGEDGLFEIDELPEGEYRVIETTAPTGFVRPDGPLVEFKVDINGKIYRKEVYKDEKGESQEKYIEEPGIVPITLVNNKEHEVVFKKVDANDKTKVLAGAEFEVWYKQTKEGEYSKDNISLYKDANGNLYALKADDIPPTGYTKLDKFTSGKDGLVKFKVNEQGYYALKEIKAPEGMKFNSNHEEITYVKDKSKITLSGLPLENEFYENNVGAKTGVTIKAYTVDKENGTETFVKSYKVDLNNYNNYKGKETIDLYELVKGDATDGSPIKSDKTIVFKMSPQIGLTTELDIKSNIVIGDKISEPRTFHIETKGDEYVNHSYKFTNMEEIDSTKPIEIENRKLSLPFTRGIRAWIGFTIIGLILMILAAYYYNKKKNKALEIEKN